MRLAIACVALFAVAARSGCGNGGQPAHDPCAGKACGDACRVCAPGARACVEPAVPPSFAMVCDPRGQCVAADVMASGGSVATAVGCDDTGACTGRFCGEPCTIDPPCRSANPPCMIPSVSGTCSADGHCLPLGLPIPACPPVADCAGKACGDACNLCAPAACGSPVATACDRSGHCVVPSGPISWLCYDPCAGKDCGAECHVCPPDALPACTETAVVKACDAAGRCVARTPELACGPSWGCVGKACGDACGSCPPGTDPARCPVPTFAPTACDARLQCVTAGRFTCPAP